MSEARGAERAEQPFEDVARDRAEGIFDEAVGRGKSAAGELLGDEELTGEGKVDQIAGKAKQGLADAKDVVNEAVKKVKDR
jgi:uncharacterized protein YjbJ (UPF0337 family)